MSKLFRLFDKFKLLFVDNASCIVCDDEIISDNPYGLCGKCFNKLEFIGDKCCIRCGKPSDNEAKYCLLCQNETRYFDMARSAVIYKGDIQRLILEYKFHNKRYLAKYLAKFIEHAVERYGIKYDVVVPIPLSKSREKERKYNQVSEMLRHTNLNPIVNALIKTKDNERQSLMAGRERRDNVRGVYEMADKAAVKNKRVLLVDDIITTGATVNEASRILMSAGAQSVIAVSVAHAEYRLKGDDKTLTGYEVINLADLVASKKVD